MPLSYARVTPIPPNGLHLVILTSTEYVGVSAQVAVAHVKSTRS